MLQKKWETASERWLEGQENRVVPQDLKISLNNSTCFTSHEIGHAKEGLQKAKEQGHGSRKMETRV